MSSEERFAVQILRSGSLILHEIDAVGASLSPISTRNGTGIHVGVNVPPTATPLTNALLLSISVPDDQITDDLRERLNDAFRFNVAFKSNPSCNLAIGVQLRDIRFTGWHGSRSRYAKHTKLIFVADEPTAWEVPKM